MDKYIGFKYNNIKLNMEDTSTVKGFIINEGEDLKFPSLPSFSNEFAFPKFGEVSYFLGEIKENREISFSIMLKEITLKKYRNFLRDISEWKDDNDNLLQFDYNDFFGYKVKLDSISEGVFDVCLECEEPEVETKYNVKLDLSFVTINDWAAQYADQISYRIADGQQTFADLYEFNSNDIENSVTITNNGSIEIFLNLIFRAQPEVGASIKVEKLLSNEPESWSLLYEIPRESSEIGVFGRFGIVWDYYNDTFAKTEKNIGAFSIGSGETLKLKFSSSENLPGEAIEIKPILREII